jgi:hypothetical protein
LSLQNSQHRDLLSEFAGGQTLGNHRMHAAHDINDVGDAEEIALGSNRVG